ncbi:MAG: hypothetical protein GX980_07685 [Firmicutes bacterium]|nr:hypothetical protein [Bacillota bacterium]
MIDKYLEQVRRHPKVLGLLTLHFTSLLTFSLWGPALIDLSMQKGADPYPQGLAFALSSALMYIFLALGKKTIDPREARRAAAAYLIAAASFLVIDPHYWIWASIISGIASSGLTAYWAELFVEYVPAQERGRSVALLMILSNGVYYILYLLIPSIASTMTVSLSLIPAAGTVWLLAGGRHFPSPSPECAKTVEPFLPRDALLPLSWTMGVFIFAFYLTGGLVYESLYLTSPEHPWARWFSTIPYIITGAIAGLEADAKGRRMLPVKACIFLGMGLVCSLFLRNPDASFLVGSVLALAAFGYMDVFLWTYLADIALAPRRAVTTYGLGLALNLITVSVGSLMPHSRPGFAVGPHFIVGAGTGILFLSLGHLVHAIDRTEEVIEHFSPPDIQTKVRQLTSKLTDREGEVLSLLISGMSNEDIAQELHVAEATVKTHLRSIYRKTGFPNRRTLLSRLVADEPPERNV